MASWIYVFGVASLVALGIVIVSGFALALGGSDWWHTNAVGHFFNSVHLWSVELFMAFLVIHLWGKFWMAAWRGRRAMTWITGVIAFMASVVTAFTGYLSQQNFDSQWIATNGKDAFNAVGIGSIWNAMNFGQMFMWHIVLMPLVLVAIVGAHILLVRVRGVSHPLPARPVRGRAARKAAAAADAGAVARRRPAATTSSRKAPSRPLVVGALTLVMAGVLSSPDVPPVTMQTWGKVAPGRPRLHGGHRTERHRGRGQLRAAVQQRDRRRPAGRAGELAEAGRDHPAGQRRAGLRARPAVHRWPGRLPPWRRR